MKKGDCFIMKGSNINEPMTLYYITEEYDDKLRALSICIKNEMVQGLDYDNEYDNDIPEEAVILPPDTYSQVKELMKMFLKETKTFIGKRIKQGDFELQVGHHYYDGYIYTITEIGEKRAKYNLFRLEEENISPYWTGDGNIDSLTDHCVPISDEVYKEVKKRYDEFVLGLRTMLYT